MQHSLERIKLTGGGEGLLIDVPSAPVVTFDFNFRAGYFLSPDGKFDTPHVLEHLMFGANQEYKKARHFNQELEKNGAYANAFTDTWYVAYVAECAAFETERILDLLLLSLTKPLLNDTELKAEMGNVHEELAGNLNRYFRVLGNEIAIASKLPTLTDEQRLAELPSITAKDVHEHYRKTHTQQNIRFIIAGDLTGKKDLIRDRLNAAFSIFPKGERYEFTKETPKGLSEPLVIERPDVEKLYYYLDLFSSSGRMTDVELDDMDVLNQLLTGSMSSRIYGAAREQGIAYGVTSGFVNAHDHAQWWFGGTVSYSNAQQLFTLMAKEIKRVAAGKITKAEVEAAKLQNLGRFMRSHQKLSDVVGTYGSRYFYDGKIEDYAKAPEHIKSVTKERVIKTANAILDQKQWTLGLLGRMDQTQTKQLYAIWEDALGITAVD